MDKNKILVLIDDIASGILTTDPADGDVLSLVGEQVRRLASMLREINRGDLAQIAATCETILSTIVEGLSGNGQQDLETIGAHISSIQTKLTQHRQGETTVVSVLPVPEDQQEVARAEELPGGSRFALPDYVDIAVFREFLSNTKHVLDEIERDTLLLEKGDSGATNNLKRRIHTLKGEAGVLALVDIEQICHAIEDMFGVNRSPRRTADLLLETIDWIYRALESYASLLLPDPRGSVLAASLRHRSRDVEPEAPALEEADDDTENLEIVSSESAPEAPRSSAETVTPFGWDEEIVVLVGEFIEESEEGLISADQILMNIDESGVEQEKINALFRTFHTIKGVAGFLELEEITKLAHITETMMDQIRDGQYPLGGGVLDLVFDSTDIMRAMLGAVREAVERNTSVRPEPRLSGHLSNLERVINGEQPSEEALPDANSGDKLGEILTRPPSNVSMDAISDALEIQKVTGRQLGEELVANGLAKPKEVSQALRAQQRSNTESGGKIKETVKVDLERVDRLVEMIGELVIVESMVVHAPEITSLVSPKIRTYLGQLEKITRDLQDTGMRMRMVPVRGVFQKMARMVRDLARKSNKSVRLVTSGEGTEMDRSMVEHITDPLVHMIRNAVDHAIEPAEVRHQKGKPKEGTVSLSAYHEGGSIIVEIADDGKGLDREAILEKARRQGLISGDEQLADTNVYKLIFAPGFSTAKQVTEISGRGVGMDVVKRNIESMRGRIAIESEPDKGSTFKLILPLTLAIIDGMLVSCGPEQYVIPTLSIVESLQVTPGMLKSFAKRGELINVRGEIYPLLRLDRLFGIPGEERNFVDGLVVVLEGVGRKVGLLVDDVLTQQQVVIKSLGNGIAQTPYISGGAIMSDGTVGLILNVEEIAEIVEKRSAKQVDFNSEISAAGLKGPPDMVLPGLSDSNDNSPGQEEILS